MWLALILIWLGFAARVGVKNGFAGWTLAQATLLFVLIVVLPQAIYEWLQRRGAFERR